MPKKITKQMHILLIYWTLALDTALKKVNDRMVAECIASATLIKLAQQKEAPKNTEGFIVRVATNLSIDHLRKQQVRRNHCNKQERLPEASAEPASFLTNHEKQFSKVLQRQIEGFLKKKRPVHITHLYLKLHRNLSYSAIALLTHGKDGAIKRAYHRSIDDLRGIVLKSQLSHKHVTKLIANSIEKIYQSNQKTTENGK